MEIVLLLNSVSRFFEHILYLANTHKLHGPSLGIIFAWMNGYSTLLHYISPVKCIVIMVEYGLQVHFKIFLNKSDRKKTTTEVIIKMLIILDFKCFHCDLLSSIDDIIPLHALRIDF